MGRPILGHLAKDGHEVWAYDVDQAKQQTIADAGATWCEDVAALAKSAEYILICVGFDQEVTEVITQDGGIFASAARESVVVVLSTVLPETVVELAAEGEKYGIDVVDAPVCRGSWFADEGTLLTFIGGPKPVFDRLKEVVNAYSTDIVHSGGHGTAQVCKASNNLVLWACLIANHEAFALADRYDVDIEVLRQALMISSADNGALELWGKQTMAWAEDDLVIVGQMANNKGISLPQAGLDRELCRSLLPRRYDLSRYGI